MLESREPKVAKPKPAVAADLETLPVRQRIRGLLPESVEAHGPMIAETAESREGQPAQREIRAPMTADGCAGWILRFNREPQRLAG